MTSNLKVNNILPSTGTTVAVSGIASVTSSVSIASSCTATTFYGTLTGTASGNPTMSSGANDRVMTATGSNAMKGESALTFDGATLNIDGGTNDTPLILDTSNVSGSHLRFRKDGVNKIFLGSGGGFGLGDVDDLSLRTTDNIIFGVGTSEKLRISSTGQFVVGTNPTVGSGNIAHIEAPTSFNSGETIIAVVGDNASAGPRLLLQNKNTGGSAHGEILGTDAGGQSTSSIRFYNTDQSNNYGEIAFGTRNVSNAPPADRMRISKDGYVTKPHTPAFFATHTGLSNTHIGTLTYNTSGNGYYNNGGHLNVSTGRFTAPVSGIYTFHFHGFIQSGNADAYYEVIMKRTNSNGSGALSLCRQYGYRHIDPSNQYGPSISMHCTCYLTAGQRVEVTTGNLPFHGSNGFFFGGHLVG